MHIRIAVPAEIEVLDRIAYSAKAHWGYSAEQMGTWASDLSTSQESVTSELTFVAEVGGTVVGFAQLDSSGEHPELVALWVLPQHIGKGIGRALLQEITRAAANACRSIITIDSEPNAADFYIACGAKFVANIPAPITGDPHRVRPQLRLSTSSIEEKRN